MKNIKTVILTIVAVFSSVTQLYAFDGLNAINNELYTKDTLAPEPLFSSPSYQEAKTWYLPDYQGNISSGGIAEDKDKKPNTSNNCVSFNGDGSGHSYIENPDLAAYTCSGPQNMANRVKCYYDCTCKAAVSITTGWKCDKYCESKCVARSCASGYMLSGSNCICATTCNHKVTSKPANSSYTYETCTACGNSSQIQSGWSCNSGYTQSGSSCICAKSCSDKVTTKPANSSYTYETCTACGSSTSIKSGWNCNSEYTKSGSSCICATTCSDKVTAKPANSSYTYENCTACGITSSIKKGWTCDQGYTQSGSTCVAACSLPTCTNITTKPANSSFVTGPCTDCSGTQTVNSGWTCNQGYTKVGNTCTTCIIYFSDNTIDGTLVSRKTPVGIVIDNFVVSIYDWAAAYSGVKSTSFYTRDNVSNWRVPTMGEMKIIYTHKAQINSCMSYLQASQMSTGWYWTRDIKPNDIYVDEFNMTTQASNLNNPSASNRVRLVKTR